MKLQRLILTSGIFFTFFSQAFGESYFDQKSILPNLIDAPLVKDSLTYKNEIESIVEIQKTAKNLTLKKPH